MRKLNFNRSKYGAFLGLIGLGTVLSILSPSFLTLSNIMNVLNQVSLNGLVAIGMTFVILSGGIDLSVGSILALSGALLAALLKNGMPQVFAILIALTLSAVFGVLNGFSLQHLICSLLL